MSERAPLLTVEDLRVVFEGDRGSRHGGGRRRELLADAAGRTLGIVGESGCGKSVTALADHAAAARGRSARVGLRRLRGARARLRCPSARCRTCAATGSR